MNSEEILLDAEERMEKAVAVLKTNLAGIRTGRANPGLVDSLRVDAYGSKMPLNQVATIHTPEPSLLVVQPFDKSLVADVEKAILSADLGLNPANDGNVIRVPIPALNEERRKEYVRLLHKMAEEGRVSIRHARHKARDSIHALIKDHELGEDDGRRQLDEVEKLTHDFTQSIDELLKSKEDEVMSI